MTRPIIDNGWFFVSHAVVERGSASTSIHSHSRVSHISKTMSLPLRRCCSIAVGRLVHRMSHPRAVAHWTASQPLARPPRSTARAKESDFDARGTAMVASAWPSPAADPVSLERKHYFDTQLRSTMAARQKPQTLQLFHEYLQHLRPAHVLTASSDGYADILLLSPDVYESLIYMLTPQDLHGATLAFHLFRMTMGESTQPTSDGSPVTSHAETNKSLKISKLARRIFRSIQLAAPKTSHIYHCYCPFYYDAYPQHVHPKLYQAIISNANNHNIHTTKRLFAIEMFMLIDYWTHFVHAQHPHTPPFLQEDHQLALFPQFIYSLLTQKYSTSFIMDATLNQWTYYKNTIHTQVFTNEEEKQHHITWCVNILKSSTYNLQRVFPFGDVLLLALDLGTWIHFTLAYFYLGWSHDFWFSIGATPSPAIVLTVLHNEFPFHNIRLVCKLLRAILHLQQNKQVSQLDYKLDLGTLQHISAMAARRGSTDLIHIIWDYFQQFHIPPTQALYEDTIVTWMEVNGQDEMVIQFLAEMEIQRGFIPPRPLIRSISRSLRGTRNRMERWNRLLPKQGHTPTPKTRAMVHCLLSAYAECGMVDSAFSLFDLMLQDIQGPDEDTYSYLMEAVAQNITTAVEVHPNMGAIEDDTWITGQLDAAEVIRQTMTQMKGSWNRHCIHHYVRILCAAGRVEEALSVMQEGDLVNRVSVETWGLLATTFALHGNRDGMERTIDTCWRCGHSLPSYTMERLTSIMGKRDVPE
jgi:pentatricopeptide repeat protein